jgi:radical SAM protein with 4Fe4S-binding SPASM domain
MSFYMLNVHENGNVAPCCGAFVDYPVLGNAFSESFNKIWDTSKGLQRQMLLGYKTISKCSKCVSVKCGCNTDSDNLGDEIELIKQRYENAGIIPLMEG